MPDIYTFIKVGTLGLANCFIKNRATRKRIVKAINKLDFGKQEEVEEMLKKVEELKEVLPSKKTFKMLSSLGMSDIDDYVKKYLKKRGIDVDEIIEHLKEHTTKSAVKKIHSILGTFDEVDRIVELKNQKINQDLKNVSELVKSIQSSLEEYKKDYRCQVEKQLLKNEAEINDIEKEKIKQEAVQEFMKKLKAQQPRTIKNGVSVGRIAAKQ